MFIILTGWNYVGNRPYELQSVMYNWTGQKSWLQAIMKWPRYECVDSKVYVNSKTKDERGLGAKSEQIISN